MKTLFNNLMFVGAVICLATLSTTSAEEKKEGATPPKLVSIFPDKNLEKAVRRVVFEKRNNDQPITEKDVENISEINGKGMGIADLTGLEKCHSLASLDLSANQIKSVAPIGGLPRLQLLNLSNNQIEDIGPLKGNLALQYIELSDNRVRDLSPVAGLTNLRNLYLSHNVIRDLQPVVGLRDLVSLYLDGNAISSLHGIGSLIWLKTLSLNDTGLSDLAGIDGMQSLNLLFLERNKISELTPLVEVIKRDAEGKRQFAPYLSVYLAGNPLSNGAKSSIESLKTFGVNVKQ